MQIFHQKQRRGSKCQSTKQHENDTAVDGMIKRGTITSLVKKTKLQDLNVQILPDQFTLLTKLNQSVGLKDLLTKTSPPDGWK